MQIALQELGEEDTQKSIDEDVFIQTTVYVDMDMEKKIRNRAWIFQRYFGREFVRLIAFAIDFRIQEELASISRAMQLLDQAAPASPPPE